MTAAEKDFISAAKKGQLDTLKAFLDRDKTLLQAQDSDGSTALHCATWKGHRDIVAFLIKAGADVHAHNRNEHWGTTPLHAAAHANQSAIAQLLLDAGADVHAQDMNGLTPLQHTMFHNAKAAAKILRQHGAV